MRHPRTLAQLRADPRIREVWQEDDGCFEADGYPLSWWASLNPGWVTDNMESALHEPTIKDLCAALHGVSYEPAVDWTRDDFRPE